MFAQWILFLFLFGIGFLCTYLLSRWQNHSVIREALKDEEETLTDIREHNEHLMDDAQKIAADDEMILRRRWDRERKKIEDQIEEIKSRLQDKEEELEPELNKKQSLYQEEKETFDSYNSQIQSQKDRLQSKIKEIKLLKSQHVEELKKIVPSHSEIKQELSQNVLNETKTRMNQFIQDSENEANDFAERNAKQFLYRVLNRFAHPYCPHRGIGLFHFDNEDQLNKALGPDRQWAKVIEKDCGIDIVRREDSFSLSISGFDPVRREWGRACLERIIKKAKRIDEKYLSNMIKEEKRKLFKRIKSDGLKLAKKLRIRDFHPEIRHMLGALKYRYSYTQNQHSHVGEVGYLCGLLASELDIPVIDGRKAGVLHDIGKAMDHSIDGGHAVIGADFIEKHGVEPHIVHPVRAHHFDEQPNSDLAYLVIAADALSGARPGARRSTTESYMQKMNQLEEIGNSYKQVQSTYVLSAGRELRVLVDSKKVSDHDAIGLSQNIAQKVEDTCNYPGSIKVTVVRSTQSVSMAK